MNCVCICQHYACQDDAAQDDAGLFLLPFVSRILDGEMNRLECYGLGDIAVTAHFPRINMEGFGKKKKVKVKKIIQTSSDFMLMGVHDCFFRCCASVTSVRHKIKK